MISIKEQGGLPKRSRADEDKRRPFKSRHRAEHEEGCQVGRKRSPQAQQQKRHGSDECDLQPGGQPLFLRINNTKLTGLLPKT